MTTDIIKAIEANDRQLVIATLCGSINAWGADATLIEYDEAAEGIADFLLEDDTHIEKVASTDVDDEEWATILSRLDITDNADDWTVFRASKWNQEAMYLAIPNA